jgi:hypothetical protein
MCFQRQFVEGKKGHITFSLSFILKKNAGFLSICTREFNWKWGNYFWQKNFQWICSKFQYKMEFYTVTPQALTSALSAEQILILSIKNLIHHKFDICCFKEPKEPPSLIQSCSLAVISFLFSKLFSFHPFPEPKPKMILRGAAHCSRCIKHKYTETQREPWRMHVSATHKICQLRKIQSIKWK